MPATSPFKFLDAYNKDDKDIFFGRDAEVEQLYQLVFQSNMTLVYGQSGTGKTSLVQCGLANRFAQSDWFNVYIRRNEDINDSLLSSLKKFGVADRSHRLLAERIKRRRQASISQEKERDGTPEEETVDELTKTLRSLFKHYLKPIYLIFDQFEELFILGDREEQQQFYRSIARILENESYCRVILIMREESIAELYDFEKHVPYLFDKRLRVERMSRARTEEVIVRTAAKFGITLADGSVPGKIMDVLSEGKRRVELTYLQVFLDRLYQEAAPANGKEIVFSSALIERLGSIEDVLGDFLSSQTNAIQRRTEQQFPGITSSAVSRVLGTFVTLEGTKRPIARGHLSVGQLSEAQTAFIVDELERSRILRFENEHYELAHDSLALQVANARTADEVAILQIAQIIRNRYQEYDATKTLLNSNELQLIKSYEKRLAEEQMIQDQQWRFVADSARADRRRRRSIAAIVTAVVLTLAVFAVYSNLQARQIRSSQEKERAANYERYFNAGNARMSASQYEDAIRQYEEALLFDPDSVDNRAADSIDVARQMLRSKAPYDAAITRGDQLAAAAVDDPRLWVEARDAYREAQATNYNPTEVNRKLGQIEGKLNAAFEDFRRAGDDMYQAGESGGGTTFQYELALEQYENAARIKPDDEYIQGRIRACERKLR